MFVTNKRVNLPYEFEIDGNKITVVTSFKLLGVTIDQKLNFAQYVGDLKRTINRRMYSIKRLFFLPTAVKIQFVKTFLLPHFDYCSSLYIYFSKALLQKLSNCYNYCLYKLIGFKHTVITSNDFNILNNINIKWKL